MYQEAKSRYQEINFTTAEPLKLVVMCYDEAAKSLTEARQSYEAGLYEAKAKALQRTLDIINEMNISLDLERGGEIARNLRSLYLYMTRTLLEADLKKDLARFDEVIGMLSDLGAAWKEIWGRELREEKPVRYGTLAAAGACSRLWSV